MVDENSPPIAATAKAAPVSGGTASGEWTSAASISKPKISPTVVASVSIGEKMPAGTPTG